MKRALAIFCLIFAGILSAHAQATVQESPQPKLQAFDNNGLPLSFGKWCTYQSGTNTPFPTYTDFTGTVQNMNPVMLDASGRAEVWYDVNQVYRVVLRSNDGTVNTCTDGTVIYTIDGVRGATGLLSSGNLPPLFTTTLSSGALSFTLSNAGAHTVYGNNTGSSAAPSFGGIGTDTQIAYNSGGSSEIGSSSLTYNASTRTFTFGDAGTPIIQLIAGVSGGQPEIHFGGTATPAIVDVTDWEFRPTNSQDLAISWGQCALCAIFTSTGGAAGVPYGGLQLAQGAFNGQVLLNDGNQSAGTFSGPKIIAGSQANPNTVYVAPQGSLYITTAGGSMTTLWVKESGAGNTGWVAK